MQDNIKKVDFILKATSLYSGIQYNTLKQKSIRAATLIWRDLAMFVTTMIVGMHPSDAAKAFGVTKKTIVESNLRTLKFNQDKLDEISSEIYELSKSLEEKKRAI